MTYDQEEFVPEDVRPGDEAPEADVADQRTPVVPPQGEAPPPVSSREANEADVVDQSLAVPADDDDVAESDRL